MWCAHTQKEEVLGQKILQSSGKRVCWDELEAIASAGDSGVQGRPQEGLREDATEVQGEAA